MNLPGPFLFSPILGAGESISMPAVFFNDFIEPGSATATGPLFSTTADAAMFRVAVTTSAIPLVEDNTNFKGVKPFGAHGVARIVNAATANDKVSCQVNGESFVIIREKPLIYETRVATSNAAATLLACGLCATGTSVVADGGATITPADFIGFVVRASSGAIIPVVKGASTETLPTVTGSPAFATNTWTVLRFEVLPTDTTNHRVNFYVDGAKVASHTSQAAALPLDASQTTPIGLTPTWEQKSLTTTANNGFCDYIFCAQMR